MHTERVQSAVSKINELATNSFTNLKFVFIAGDITNTALKSQLVVQTILNNLTVQYYPIIGNHDQWPHSSTWETEQSVGDQIFLEAFKAILTSSNIIGYPNGTVYDPKEKRQS
ncbi:unnamed protein product [Didymodactylos carnosus]|uniref:Calcineurin-like phosphoesterase domain-containing protein n=1 Tax=Didymodactylos carnosus TaxID=1234261 RepID=A0A814A2H1_9BILA|nr:unnamed protein product [Didymodactylos carnosus]CAF1390061.1 unnamed protein product [Didymodactylos carnosus]CAF3689960.1 unnamed protein product [Didymodactylos carnosus]CAF4197629.1 unnamed protein product [Didymodactylos carnosus]